jgi:hypothetical protein
MIEKVDNIYGFYGAILFILSSIIKITFTLGHEFNGSNGPFA